MMKHKRMISFFEGYDEDYHIKLAKSINVEFCLYFMENDNYYRKFDENNITFLGQSRYINDVSELKKSVNFHLINYLSIYENTIYNLIQRFNRLNKTRGNFEKIREYYLKILDYADNLLIENKIDILIYKDTPHQPLEYILFLLAKKYSMTNIVIKELPSLHYLRPQMKYLTFDYPFLDSRFYEIFQSSINKNDILNSLSAPMSQLFYEFDHFKGDRAQELQPSEYHYGKKFLLSDFKQYFFQRKKQIRTLKTLFIKSIRFIIYSIYFTGFNKKKLTKFYNNISQKPDLNQKFYYFPLHYQPEATTNPLGGLFQDQFLVIKAISLSIPEGTLLYVKEHPRYFKSSSVEGMQRSRSINFYKEVASLSNVVFIHHFSNPYELIMKSIGIITVTGTVAFEAFGFNKPCIVWGNYIYKQFDNAFSPHDLNQLKLILHQWFKNPIDYTSSFIRTLYSLDQLSISVSTHQESDERDLLIELIKTELLDHSV
jgi:hypothetical protein